jgi:NADPH:quinone reductase-like Zn-dependent oxidoreductase
MKAIVQDRYGSAEVLELRDIEKPVIKDDEVLLRVHAASAHIGDWHVMTGLPYLIRLVVPTLGLRAPKARVRGMDVAGSIEAVGKDVMQFRPGDEVFGIGNGSFAEYATARTDKLVPKPANLTFEQAAACPISGLAALQAVRDKAQVQPGQKVLIIGAGGAVGTFAVQITKAFGGHVTGVSSTSKVELVRSLGADEVIDYTREDFAENGQHYHAILDTAGARSVPQLRRALTPKGSLVIVGSEGGGRWFGGFGRNLRAQMLSPFVSQKLGLFASKEKGEDLVVLKKLIEAGKVTPVIDRTYPLNEVPEAMRRLEAGHARGKLVITL